MVCTSIGETLELEIGSKIVWCWKPRSHDILLSRYLRAQLGVGDIFLLICMRHEENNLEHKSIFKA
jgi:hypothetical protein